MGSFVDFFKSILPLVGVMIGWGFSQWSERLKTAREDRRKLKKTLYYLLELRYQIRLFEDNNENIKKGISIVEKKFPIIKQVDSAILNAIVEQLSTQLQANRPETIKTELATLKSNFVKSVEALSEVDPILAFRLGGRQSIDELFEVLLKNTKESIGSIAKMTPNDYAEMEKAFKFFEPKLLKESLAQLEEVALDVAEQIDHKTYKETKKRLEPMKEESDFTDLEEFIDRLFSDAPIPSQ